MQQGTRRQSQQRRINTEDKQGEREREKNNASMRTSDWRMDLFRRQRVHGRDEVKKERRKSERNSRGRRVQETDGWSGWA